MKNNTNASNKFSLNNIVIKNFMTVKNWQLTLPFLLLILCVLYLFVFNNGGDYKEQYVNIQKELFFYLNSELSKFPDLQYNLTQLGDVLIFFSFLSVFIVYAPKLWEVLLNSAILSLIVSAVLKELLDIPRPAALFDHDIFVIIGKAHHGVASLPSGHSIAAFVVVTTLLYALMPKKNKILWCVSMLALGVIIAFSRVAVGAHYPFDTIIGSVIGYIVTIIGIRISTKLKWLNYVRKKKYLPVLIVLIVIWACIIIHKIIENNLPVFYLSLLSLGISLFLISKLYVQTKN